MSVEIDVSAVLGFLPIKLNDESRNPPRNFC